MEKEKVLYKVRKMLTLASDNPDADECQTALLMAQRMLAKHNLSIQDVECGTQSRKVEDGTVLETSRTQWWEEQLAYLIADNFRCYAYLLRLEKGKRIQFLGLKEEVEIVKEVFLYAKASIKYYADQYVRKNQLGGNHQITIAIKNDYIDGFLSGLEERFKKQTSLKEWGLVLVKDNVVVEAFEDLMRNATKRKGNRRTIKTVNDRLARAQGFSDGKNYDPTAKHITD